jgi:hypothetical protein
MPHKDPQAKRDYDKAFYHVRKQRKQITYETQRDFALRRGYGITLEDYKRMLVEQNSCCKMCDKHSSLFKRCLHVDHCHKTGVIRGLLCTNCNTALGIIESEELNERALRYLNG